MARTLWAQVDSFGKLREEARGVNRPEKVNILTDNGTTEVTVADARTLSEYARYLNFVRGTLRGDPGAAKELAKFAGKTFTDAQRKRDPYITDRTLLSRLYNDGRISMEEFYAETAR